MAVIRYAGDRFVGDVNTTTALNSQVTGVLDGAFYVSTGNLKTFIKRSAGWAEVAGGGGGGSTDPAGSDHQVQFNDNGVFGATTGLTFDGQRLFANNLQVSGIIYDSNVSVGENGMVLTNEGQTGIHWKSIESVLSGVGGSGVQNYVARWSDEDTLTSGTIYDNATNVGIGTTNPLRLLHVAGDVFISGKLYDAANSTGSKGYVLTSDDAGPVWAASGDFDTLSGNLIATGAIVDDVSGNLITTGQTLTSEINTVSGNLISTGVIIDDVSGNLITTGQTLTTNLTATGAIVDDISGNLISTGNFLEAEIAIVSGLVSGDPEIVGTGTAGYLPKFDNENSITNSVVVESNSNIGIGITTPQHALHVSGNAIISGKFYDQANSTGSKGYVLTSDDDGPLWKASGDFDGLSGNLVATGAIIDDISGNLVTTGQTLTSEINTVSGNLISTGAIVDDISGNLITTGQTLTTNIDTVAANLISTGTVVDDISGNLISTGNFLESEIAIVSGLVSGDPEIVGTGTAGYLSKFDDENSITNSVVVESNSNIGIGITTPQHVLHISGDAIVSGKFYDQTNSTGSKGYVLTSDDDGPLWKASGDFDGLSGNLVATGAIVDDISGNLITTGQTLQTQITSNDADIATLTSNLIATGAIVDDISGNLITTGQTLTSDINTVTTNLVATGAIVDDISGNLITTGQTLTDNLISTGAIVDDVSGNLISTGNFLESEIAIVSGLVSGDPEIVGTGTAGFIPKFDDENSITDSIIKEDSSKIGIGVTNPQHKFHLSGDAIISGKLYDSLNSTGSKGYVLTSDDTGPIWAASGDFDTLSGNLVATGAIVDDISGNLITTGQTLTTNINTVSTNLVATGAIVDDISGNLITTGQTLTTNINTVSTNLIATGAIVDDISGNLIQTGQYLTDEIAIVSGLVSTGAIDGSGVANYVARWSDGNTITSGVIQDDGTAVGINQAADPDNALAIKSIANNTNPLQIAAHDGDSLLVFRQTAGDGRLSIKKDGGVETIRLDSDNVSYITGSLGLGTGYPDNKLHIVGDNGDQLKLDNDGDAWTQLDFANNDTNKIFLALDHANHYFVLGAQGGYSDLKYISFRPDGTNDDMVIERDGNVGVGTTTPGGKLESYITTGGEKGLRLNSNFAGGNTVDFIPAIVGVSNAGFSIDLAGTNRFVINSNGNVGIGTNSPAGKLHILSSDLNNNLILESNETGASTAPDLVLYRSSTSAADNDYIGVIRFRGKNDNGTPEDVEYGAITSQIKDSTDGSEDGELALWTMEGGTLTQQVTLNSVGNVGIGTATPAVPLHITKSAVGDNEVPEVIRLSTLNSASPSWSTTDGLCIGAEMKKANGTTITKQPIRFRYDGGDMATTFEAGNVGIGTDQPLNLLMINGSSPIIRFRDSNASGTPLAYIDASDGALKLQADASDETASSFLTLEVDGSEHVRVVADGNVGIGTTDPVEKLDIDGNTVVRGSVYFDGVSSSYIDNASHDLQLKGAAGVSLWTHVGTWQERLTVTDPGSVGIGIDTPAHNLHVSGDAIISGYLYDSTNSTGVDGYVLTSKEDGPQWKMIEEVLSGVGGNGTANYVPKWEDSDTIGNSIIYDNGSNIGIGNAVPSGTLDIVGSNGTVDAAADGDAQELVIRNNDRAGIQIFSANNSYGSLIFGSASDANGANIFYAPNDKLLTLGTQVADGQVALRSANGAEAVRIDAGGDVGIGTNAPYYKLDLRFDNSNTSFSGGSGGDWGGNGLRIENDNSTVGSMALVQFRTSTADWFIGNKFIQSGPDQSDFIFSHEDSEKVRIKHDGNVGIGTTTPSVLLDVNGTIQANKSVNYKNSTRTWQIQGDNSPDQLKFIDVTGSTTPFAIEGTAPSSSLYINSDGNVGIGTNSPSRPLEVIGTGSASVIRVGDGDSDGNAGVSYIEFGANATSWNRQAYIGPASPSNSHLWIVNEENADILFYANNDEKMVIKNDGNVGIGTNDPKNKLTITDGATSYTTANILLQIKRNASNGDDDTSKASIMLANNSNGFQIAYGGTSDRLRFIDGGAVERITLVNGGNVGIGTTAPADKLHIQGNVLQLDSSPEYHFGTTGAGHRNWRVACQEVVDQGFEIASGTTSAGSSAPSDTYTTRFVIKGATGQVQLNSYGSGTHTGTSEYKLSVDSDGNIIETAIGAGAVDGAGTANYITRWTDADTIGNSNIFDNGTIGIGTASNLNGKVTIRQQGNSVGDQHIFCQLSHSAVGYGASIFLKTSTNTDNNRYGARITSIRNANDNAAADLAFSLENTAANALDEVVRFTSDGDVGIGTSAPSSELHIASSDNRPTIRLQGNKTGDGNFADIYATNDGTNGEAQISFRRVGANDAVDTLFYTSATGSAMAERMRIKSDGNVGIGTDNPVLPLHIYRASDNVYAKIQNGSTSQAALQLQTATTDGNWVMYIPSNSSNLRFYQGADKVTLTADGDVGIGTNAPVKKLDVRAAASWDGIHIGSTAGSATAIDFARSTTHANPTARIGVAEPAATHTSDMRFFTSDASGGAPNLVEKMRIDPNGNVGIGLTDPDAKLEIKGTGGGTGLTFKTTDSSSNNIFWVMDGGKAGLHYYPFVINQDNSDSDCPAATFFYVHHATAPFTIKNDGKVGIGTTNPSEPLHVRSTSGAAAIFERSDAASVGIRILGSGMTTSTCPKIHAEAGPDLAFTVNNAERMRILDTGSVGIGTAAPSAALDVVVSSTVWAAEINQTNASNGDGLFVNTGSTASADYVASFRADNTNLFDVKANGNVGINKAAPAYKLHVVGDITLDSANSTTDTTLRWEAGSATKWRIKNDTQIAGGTDHTLTFTSAGTANVSINQTGNVGIGTTAPANKFHINDGTNINLGIAAASTAIKFNALNDAISANIPMEFGASVFGFVGGSVGIGTNAPSSILHLYHATSPKLLIEDTTNNVKFMAYAQNSNVHIGTNSAHDLYIDVNTSTNAIHISQSNGTVDIASSKMLIGGSAGTDGYVLTTDGAGGIAWEASPGAGSISGSGTANKVAKFTGGSAIGNSQITDNGTSVGINQGSPQAANKLEVIGRTRISGDLIVGSAGLGQGTPAREIWIKGSGTQGMRIEDSVSSNYVYDITCDFTNGFRITDVTSTKDPFTIAKTTGNVGIGTTAPTQLLDTNGTAYFRDDIYFGNTVLNPASGFSNQTGMGWDKSTGQLQIAANGTAALEIGRHTSTGTVFSVRYASTQKASIDTSGNMSLSGTLTEASSLAIKENIEDFTPRLDIINKIRPVKYNKKKESKKEIGLIAEELAELFPELVEKDEKGNPSGVNYSRAVTVLLGGFKELYKEVQELKKRI